MRHKAFAAMLLKHGFWFRVYGLGLYVVTRRYHIPLFSERYGYKKAYYLGPLRFEVLWPNKCHKPID